MVKFFNRWLFFELARFRVNQESIEHVTHYSAEKDLRGELVWP